MRATRAGAAAEPWRAQLRMSGWAGIRTQGTRKGTAVFKTAAFVHSATHPTRDPLNVVILAHAAVRDKFTFRDNGLRGDSPGFPPPGATAVQDLRSLAG